MKEFKFKHKLNEDIVIIISALTYNKAAQLLDIFVYHFDDFELITN